MRFSFANGEHADFIVDSGVVELGSSNGNALQLTGRDVAPSHARITLDERGAVLEVLDSHAQTHLNARPVREKALLRCGDVLCLGRVTIILKADRDDLIDTALPPLPSAPASMPIGPSRVLLRGVAGSHFGKTIIVPKTLVIGRQGKSDLVIDEARIAPQQLRIDVVGNQIHMRELDKSGEIRVNGIPVRHAILHPGDQITLGGNQFLIEAPGFPLRGELPVSESRAITDCISAVADPAQSDNMPGNQGGVWWLIGVAALIALAFALLIYRGA